LKSLSWSAPIVPPPSRLVQDGLDDMAVVDPECRVWALMAYVIADASVMPAVPSGNCHAGYPHDRRGVADS